MRRDTEPFELEDEVYMEGVRKTILPSAELAEEIFKDVKRKIHVVHICSEDWKADAIRPKNSRMSMQQLRIAGFQALPDWKAAVKRFLVFL